MHDLDRAMFETGEVGYEAENAEQEEFLELLDEQEHGETSQGESAQLAEVDRTTLEMELATELLEVQTEEELGRWFGNVVRGAVGAAGRFAQSPTGRALGGIVKKAAGEALPVIGRGIGGLIDPQYADTGERVGKGLGTAFGLELEGLSQEDREFELARALVRFAGSASRQAAKAPSGTSPQAAALAAATAAARRYLPGLQPSLGQGRTVRRRSGRWQRRGDQIVIFGA